MHLAEPRELVKRPAAGSPRKKIDQGYFWRNRYD